MAIGGGSFVVCNKLYNTTYYYNLQKELQQPVEGIPENQRQPQDKASCQGQKDVIAQVIERSYPPCRFRRALVAAAGFGRLGLGAWFGWSGLACHQGSEAAEPILTGLAEVMGFPSKQQATPPGYACLVGARSATRAGGNVGAGHAVALCFCKARQYTQKKPASGES